MESKLVVVAGKAQASEFPLKLPAIIGRSRTADVPLGQPLVSRQHCEVFEADGHLMVRDLGSLNGTFVGDVRVTAEVELPPGSLLTIGSVTFKAVYNDVSEAADGSADEDAHSVPSGGSNGASATAGASGERDGAFDMNWLDNQSGSGDLTSPVEANSDTQDGVEDLMPPSEPMDREEEEPAAPQRKSAGRPAAPTGKAGTKAAAEKSAGAQPEAEAGGEEDLDDFFRSLAEG